MRRLLVPIALYAIIVGSAPKRAEAAAPIRAGRDEGCRPPASSAPSLKRTEPVVETGVVPLAPVDSRDERIGTGGGSPVPPVPSFDLPRPVSSDRMIVGRSEPAPGTDRLAVLQRFLL